MLLCLNPQVRERIDKSSLEKEEQYEQQFFWNKLNDDLTSPTSLRELVLFIHGYNVDFKGAVTSAAQLALDTHPNPTELQRTAVAFDWASTTSLWGYKADMDRAERASSKLLQLLQGLQQVRCGKAVTGHRVVAALGCTAHA